MALFDKHFYGKTANNRDDFYKSIPVTFRLFRAINSPQFTTGELQRPYSETKLWPNF
jgi:hypothetical protein